MSQPRPRPWRTATAIGLTVFLALVGTLGASALWTTVNKPLPASVDAATVSSTLAPSADYANLTGEYKYAAAPSTSKIGMLTYTNTGTAPVATTLTVAGGTGTLGIANPATTFGAQVAVSLWSTSGTGCETSVPVGAATGTLAAPPALPAAFASVAAGASVRLCVATRVTAPLSATQGSTITPTFTLTGRVGNWSTVAPAASFTQTVYRVAAPKNPRCAPGILGAIQLSWDAVPNATSYAIYASGGAAPVQTSTSPTAPLNTVNLGNVLAGATGPMTVSIVALESGVASTSQPTPHVIYVRPGLGPLIPSLACTAV